MSASFDRAAADEALQEWSGVLADEKYSLSTYDYVSRLDSLEYALTDALAEIDRLAAEVAP